MVTYNYNNIPYQLPTISTSPKLEFGPAFGDLAAIKYAGAGEDFGSVMKCYAQIIKKIKPL